LTKSGLTDFGREVVTYIDSNSILLDVSHSSPTVVEEVLNLTENPFVVSQTGTYGNCKPPNLSDNLMKKIAIHGNLIGIGFWDAICNTSSRSVAQAIQHAVNLVGD